jgi:hypothetical protein
MDQVALVDVLPPAEPRSAYPAALQIVGERALDEFGPVPHPGLADLGAQPVAVGVARGACVFVAVPAEEALALRLGDRTGMVTLSAKPALARSTLPLRA